MPGIDLTTAQNRLQQYLDAEAAVLTGQRYSINGRTLDRANLGEIQQGIEIWNKRVQQLSARASGRSAAIVPRPGF